MPVAVAYAVLWAHEARGLAPHPDDGPFFDAFDVAVELESGGIVVFGLRTVGYLREHREGGAHTSSADLPLPVTLDLATVKHFDFDEVLWLGPDPHPCIVWSNAEGLSSRGIASLVEQVYGGRILAGPEGRGLPTAAGLGLELDPSLVWHRVHVSEVPGA